MDYYLKSIETIYSIKHKNGAIRRVNINIAATTVDNYRLLKEAGIVDMFKIGTKNYYHLSGDKKNWDRFTVLMRQIEALMAQGNKDCSQRKELEEDERHRGDGGPAFRPELSE